MMHRTILSTFALIALSVSVPTKAQDGSECSSVEIEKTIKSAFQAPPTGRTQGSTRPRGLPPNPADVISGSGPTVASGIDICRERGIEALKSGLSIEYRLAGDERGRYFQAVNAGPLREQFARLIETERLLANNASSTRTTRSPRVQAVYFIDGTNSAFRQRNLLHQLSRSVQPINERQTSTKGFTRVISGIALNADGVNDVYSLAATSMRNDVLSNGVTDLYVFGFSRGAIVALTLMRDICNEGSPKIKVDLKVKKGPFFTSEETFTEVNSRDFLPVCEKIKAVVLIDPVNTLMAGWSSSLGETLKNRTLILSKENRNEGVLSTTSLSNAVYEQSIPQLNHAGMMCGRDTLGGAGESNLNLVRQAAISFVRERGLNIDTPYLQDCRSFNGAWPPCLYRSESSTLQCSRDDARTNWQLDEW